MLIVKGAKTPKLVFICLICGAQYLDLGELFKCTEKHLIRALVQQERTNISAAISGVAIKLEVTPRTIWQGLRDRDAHLQSL